jgi:hypothetical protein
MDFGLRSAKNNRAEALDAGWCDITSLLLKRHGRYDFGLTIQGFFVPPLSHTSQHAARARPEILISDSSSLEDAEVFSRALHETATQHTMLPATGYDQTNINEQRDGFVTEANASFNLSFDVDAAAYIEGPSLEGTVGHTDTQFGTPDQDQFFSDFAPDSTSSYSEDLFGLGMNSRSTGTPSSEISFTTFANTSPTLSPQPSSSTLNPRSPEPLSFSLSPSPSPNSASQFQSPNPSTVNGRHVCRLCSSTFKRKGDLGRHWKKHLPEQANFHCRHPHCDRNGRNGFYRRDKLIAHQKQVHDL